MKSLHLRRSDESGTALVLALVSLMIVATFATTMLKAVDNERAGVALQIDKTQAIKIADGMLQAGENLFLDRISNFQSVQTPTAQNDYVVQEGVYDCQGVPGDWSVARAVDWTNPNAPTMVAGAMQIDTAGLNTFVTPYVVNAVVQSGNARVTTRRHLELRQTPIFQFLSFYAGDLEILPGPAMTMGGRIHTNENLYVGAGASLTMDTKYVRAAGKLHRKRKDDSSVQSGWIKLKHATTNALVTLQSKANLQALGVGSTFGMDSDFTGWEINGDNLFSLPGEMAPFKTQAASLFGGTLGTGEMGVAKLEHPSIGSLEPYAPTLSGTGGDFVESTPGVFTAVAAGTGTHAKGHFHANAGLVIRDTQVFSILGANITALMPSEFITTRTMWDARENKTVTLTQVNLNKLKDMDGNAATNDPSPFFPTNGLLYVSRSDTTASSGSGVVLSGGAELNAALTVVSPAPVYIHGNFNLTNKKAAAVISDACHLLSSAWNWTNSSSSGLRVANSTTYNVAIIAGNTNTIGGAYNGGFENFPRFHENWTGKICTIKGSFVCTWNSKFHKGSWVYGSPHYTAPTRDWSYESSFDNPSSLPPFTPQVNTTRAIAWEMSL